MSGVLALTEALAQGGQVVWDAPKPRLLVPPGFRSKVEAHRETVREVLRRAAIFREQAFAFIQGGQALPLLTLPEYGGEIGGGCISCGAAAAPGSSRCPICALAVELALAALEEAGRSGRGGVAG